MTASTTVTRPSFPMAQVVGKPLAATTEDPYFVCLRAALKGSTERIVLTVTAEEAKYTARVKVTWATITDGTCLVLQFEGITGGKRQVKGACAFDPKTLALKAASLTFLR